jgi:ribosome-binding protein aMBF1 (putative translation factor)
MTAAQQNISPVVFHEERVMPKPLRAVGPDEKASPKTVSQAAEAGTTRELLVAMRDRIARAVENPNTAARDLAALTKRLVEVVRDIEAIDAREESDGESGPTEDEAWSAI